MRSIKCKGMKPEMVVRRLAHGLGNRYRLHWKNLPGKPDLVFGPRRLVIFVHGCFWHQHKCRDGRVPSTNRENWEPKLAHHVERDKKTGQKLAVAGWRVLVVWECETRDEAPLADRLVAFLGKRPPSSQRDG